jgi:hypothetical protein
VEWLKMYTLSSNPITAKKKKKKDQPGYNSKTLGGREREKERGAKRYGEREI